MSTELQLAQAFRKLYGTQPRLFSAPGRVNLIGEHTDYNQGFVLPIAANRRTYVAANLRNDDLISVHSFDLAKTTRVRPGTEALGNGWERYVNGIVRALTDRGYQLRGADVAVLSEIPIGAGLSSSAALEIALGFALLSLAQIDVDPLQLALAAQQVEHSYVGTKSGLMDQLTAAFSRKCHALFIDCRSTAMELISMNTPQASVVVCDTKMQHTLATSAYNTRRDECEQAVKILQQLKREITALRDLTVSDLDLLRHLPGALQRRCRHVISENDRTLAAAQALRAGDVEKLGQLMNESHRSLRDDYEVSCRELDLMVEIARKQPAFLGGRMMGGGFGGCTVNLVISEEVQSFSRNVLREYTSETGLEPSVYIIKADAGVSEISASL